MAKFNLEKIREKIFRKKNRKTDEQKKPGLIVEDALAVPCDEVLLVIGSMTFFSDSSRP